MCKQDSCSEKGNSSILFRPNLGWNEGATSDFQGDTAGRPLGAKLAVRGGHIMPGPAWKKESARKRLTRQSRDHHAGQHPPVGDGVSRE